MVAEAENIRESTALSPLGSNGMNEGPFGQPPAMNLEQYSQTFGNRQAGKDEGKNFSEQEKEKRERAKKANRIYRRVCEDIGLKACFFSNFGDWTEYVDGRMSDAQFRDNTVERARRMMAGEN